MPSFSSLKIDYSPTKHMVGFFELSNVLRGESFFLLRHAPGSIVSMPIAASTDFVIGAERHDTRPEKLLVNLWPLTREAQRQAPRKA